MKIEILAVVFATIGFVAIGTANTQPPTDYFYETLIVGNAGFPCTDEVGVLSAWEQYNVPQWGGGIFGANNILRGGIFADWNTSALQASAIHAAALDSNPLNAIPGVFFPTGGLAVAKNVAGFNGIETYSPRPLTNNVVNPTSSQYVQSQELISQFGGPVSYAIQTGSLNPVLCMDIANGYLPPASPSLVTDYIITAEMLLNTVWLGAYGLTNPMNGQPCLPWVANATNTRLAGCQALTTSNGKPGTSANSRTDIVFVDSANVAHGQWFEIPTATFPVGLDQQTLFPAINNGPGWPLPLPPPATVAGIWICQAPQFANFHNVGISVNSNVAGAANWFCILHDLLHPNPATGLFWHVVQGFGGGPVCHIPTGQFNNVASPSYWALGLNIPSGAVPTGWYVVDDQSGPGPYILEAVDANGMRPGVYVYPYTPGYWPNGTPLSDPCAIGFVAAPGQSNYERGLVWLTETNGVNPQIQLVRGAPHFWIPWLGWNTFNHGIFVNHVPLPPLPKQQQPPVFVPWQCSQILQDQKTNSKADYGLFIPGY
ncbi:MAG: hypothetical protein JXQ29_11505 [Planctomycetes bacterium]|nr:hypothetical protein [Planctomycetota bacterium]